MTLAHGIVSKYSASLVLGFANTSTIDAEALQRRRATQRAHQPPQPQCAIAPDAQPKHGPQRQSSAHRQLRHAQKKRPEAFLSGREAPEEVAPDVRDKQGARAGAEESRKRRAEEEIKCGCYSY